MSASGPREWQARTQATSPRGELCLNMQGQDNSSGMVLCNQDDTYNVHDRNLGHRYLNVEHSYAMSHPDRERRDGDDRMSNICNVSPSCEQLSGTVTQKESSSGDSFLRKAADKIACAKKIMPANPTSVDVASAKKARLLNGTVTQKNDRSGDSSLKKAADKTACAKAIILVHPTSIAIAGAKKAILLSGTVTQNKDSSGDSSLKKDSSSDSSLKKAADKTVCAKKTMPATLTSVDVAAAKKARLLSGAVTQKKDSSGDSP